MMAAAKRITADAAMAAVVFELDVTSKLKEEHNNIILPSCGPALAKVPINSVMQSD